jgi:Transglycosylase/Domain of Unknown Function (DUF748)
MVLGVALVAAWLPSLVRSRVSEVARERFGLAVTVTHVSIGLGGVSLAGLHFTSPMGLGVRASVAQMRARAGLLSALVRGSVAIERAELEGVAISIDRTSPAALDLMRRLQRGAPSTERQGSAGEREVKISGLAFALGEGPRDVVRCRGANVQWRAGRLTGRVASLKLAHGHAIAELRGLEVVVARSPQWRLEKLAAEGAEVVLDEVASEGASRTLVPASDGAPRSLATWSERLGAGATLLVRSAQLTRQAATGRTTILQNVRAELRAESAQQMHVSVHGAADGGGRMDVEMRVWPGDLRADGKVTLRALPLTLLSPLLPQVPWYEPERSSIDAELEVRAESPARVALSGRAVLERGAIFSPRIAPTPVHVGKLSLEGKGAWLPAQRRLEVSDGRLGLGEASVAVTGALELTPEHYALEVDAQLPSTKCTLAVHAIPEDLLADLARAEWTGALAARLQLKVDSRALKKTVLEVDVRDNCEFLSLPTMADLRRFYGPFTHSVLEPDDTLFEFETGPGTDAWTPIEAISPYLIHAVLTHEDPGFFAHKGFSLLHIRNALVRNLEEGRYVVGASTITMQLVKNVFLRREKTLSRKLQEVLLTWWTERAMPKRDVLQLYLNVIEYGPGVYGIRHAAKHYFNRLPSDLSPAEAVFLSTILPSPKRYHSFFEKGAITPTWQTLMRRQMQRLQQRGAYSPEAVEYGLREIDAFKFVPEGTAAAPRVIPGEAALLPIDAPVPAPALGDEGGETFDDPPEDYE